VLPADLAGAGDSKHFARHREKTEPVVEFPIGQSNLASEATAHRRQSGARVRGLGPPNGAL